MNFNIDIKSLVISLVALVISIDVHEFSHAWAAYLLGDDTAKRMGRLSLNPLVHLDPLGAVMMLVSSFAGFGIGWGKPVPYNPRNLRVDARTGGGVVAVAGPVSNLILASLVDGVYDADPLSKPNATRFREITVENWGCIETTLAGSHATDVTGGMLSKVRDMFHLVLAFPGLRAHIISGERPGHITSALLDDDCDIGTLIH